jgi:TolB protein
LKRTARAALLLLAGCGATHHEPSAPAAPAIPAATTQPATPASPATASAADTHAAPAAPAPRKIPTAAERAPRKDLVLPGETHFKTVRQLTFGGQNAEAYWSWDDHALTMQISDPPVVPCDQIFLADIATGFFRQVTDSGRNTCSYFMPGDAQILFASTAENAPGCPPEPDRSHGYVWPLYEYDIYVAQRDGSGRRNITHSPGYDAEATVAADGRIIFTSSRSGDIELWSMNAEGGDLHQITHEVGYDGGAFFSPDGTRIVWRASRPKTPEEVAQYRDLLARNLVMPTVMELYVADADGSNVRQLTSNGKANFAPYFTPDGRSLLFASNMADPKGRSFEIWKIDVDGSHLEQITHDPGSFASFPMFSHDGRWLAFSSNRNGSVPHETNVFVAEWVP